MRVHRHRIRSRPDVARPAAGGDRAARDLLPDLIRAVVGRALARDELALLGLRRMVRPVGAGSGHAARVQTGGARGAPEMVAAVLARHGEAEGRDQVGFRPEPALRIGRAVRAALILDVLADISLRVLRAFRLLLRIVLRPAVLDVLAPATVQPAL